MMIRDMSITIQFPNPHISSRILVRSRIHRIMVSTRQKVKTNFMFLCFAIKKKKTKLGITQVSTHSFIAISSPRKNTEAILRVMRGITKAAVIIFAFLKGYLLS